MDDSSIKINIPTIKLQKKIDRKFIILRMKKIYHAKIDKKGCQLPSYAISNNHICLRTLIKIPCTFYGNPPHTIATYLQFKHH